MRPIGYCVHGVALDAHRCIAPHASAHPPLPRRHSLRISPQPTRGSPGFALKLLECLIVRSIPPVPPREPSLHEFPIQHAAVCGGAAECRTREPDAAQSPETLCKLCERALAGSDLDADLVIPSSPAQCASQKEAIFTFGWPEPVSGDSHCAPQRRGPGLPLWHLCSAPGSGSGHSLSQSPSRRFWR